MTGRRVICTALIFSILIFGFSLFKNQNAGGKLALLIAVHDAQASTTMTQHLYAYHFADGKYVNNEKLVSVKIQKEENKKQVSNVRFDLGTNLVYKNRYVVTGIGNIIDAKNKKVLLDEKDQFIKFSGDSVVYFVNDIFRGKFYKVYNLKTESYSEVKDLLYKAVLGKDVEVDYSLKLLKIYLYPPNAPKITLVNDAGYGEDYSQVTEKKSYHLPVYWIDNSNFVYPNYSQKKDFCTIYKVNTDSKSTEVIGTIEAIPSMKTFSYFYKDLEGNLVYNCGKGNYVLDLKKKKLTQMLFESLGNSFSISVDEDPKKGRTIRFKDGEIGKYFCEIKNVKTGNAIIAISYDMMVNGERYYQGVMYWEPVLRKWKEIPVLNDVASIVGFVEE